LEKIIGLMIDAITRAGFKGCDERKKSGDIRHIAARSGGAEGGEILAGVVASRELSAREFGRLKDAVQKLGSRNRALAGAVLNVKTDGGNFIWGPVFKTISGKKFLEHELDGFKFRADISAFFQVNGAQTEAIFGHVRGLLGRRPHANVLELYSGVGGLTAYIAEGAGRIDAVEEWRPAARRLKENMELNGIGNVRAHMDSVENFLNNREAASPGVYDAVVLDPPRTGCGEGVVEGIKRISPKTIVYVSCNPATLARDISRFVLGGEYELAAIEVFDMFPQTAHVESVALLEGK
jgi:23S rRNA (uracil1939-C5)-methyltransferase